MNEVILVINSGSSSIKYSLFAYQQDLKLLHRGKIEEISSKGHEAGIREIFTWFEQLPGRLTLKAVGHRVVHGGKYFFHPTNITDEVISTLETLIPLAPLHQAQDLHIIKMIKSLYPTLLQVACFDTTFHLTQEKLATLFALPRALSDAGVIRYGFHGISYEYITSVITQTLGDIGNGRVIIAHLGNGSSMCGVYQRKSVATSMGFTALEGLMMGTRCGRIDPGVLLYLLQEKHYTAKQLEHLLYEESGLLGVSGISHDVRTLLTSDDANAQEAIDLFCYRAALEVGSLSSALNGCDALVFAAGIGENAAVIREKICERLSWLGVSIDKDANRKNSNIISHKNSKVSVCIIPTDEEYMIAQHTFLSARLGSPTGNGMDNII